METLATLRPDIARQWDYKLNGDLKPDQITLGSNRKVWWICCGGADHSWQCAVADRVRRNTGCPYCKGLKACAGQNFSLDFPELCVEWDHERNELQPSDYLSGSSAKVWWRCTKNPEHRWQATINNRTSKGHPCPFCAGKRVDSTTSLLAKHPKLCEEWDDETDPNTVLPNSHKKFWWKCKNDPTHRWQANPNNRVSNYSVCPYCSGSNGEMLIREFLELHNIEFSQEYRIPECKYQRTLPFDFAIHKPRLALIEFQGGQHFFSVSSFGGNKVFKGIQLRDQIKRDFCKRHRIPLLEIRYDQVRDIPKLIDGFLKP